MKIVINIDNRSWFTLILLLTLAVLFGSLVKGINTTQLRQSREKSETYGVEVMSLKKEIIDQRRKLLVQIAELENEKDEAMTQSLEKNKIKLATFQREFDLEITEMKNLSQEKENTIKVKQFKIDLLWRKILEKPNKIMFKRRPGRRVR